MQDKMSAKKSQFIDDTTTNINSLSKAWNYLFMTVN